MVAAALILFACWSHASIVGGRTGACARGAAAVCRGPVSAMGGEARPDLARALRSPSPVLGVILLIVAAIELRFG
jgi:hypothetical protein